MILPSIALTLNLPIGGAYNSRVIPWRVLKIGHCGYGKRMVIERL